MTERPRVAAISVEFGARKFHVEAVVIQQRRLTNTLALNGYNSVITGTILLPSFQFRLPGPIIHIQIRIHVREDKPIGISILTRHHLIIIVIVVREQPGGSLGLFPADVTIPVLIGDVMVVQEANGGCGFDTRRGVNGVVEGGDRNAIVTAGERVGRVDVAVTRDTEGGGVSLAGDVGGGMLADLAEEDPRVAGRELVGSVDLGVAAQAEEGGVGSAEEGGSGRLARVA